MYVADTAVGAIKVITPTKCKFLKLLDSLCKMFGVHWHGVQAESHSIEDAISTLSKLTSVVDFWENEIQKKMGRKAATQGPQGTISSKSKRSVEILRVIMFIERFSERGQPSVRQLSQTGRHLDTCCGKLFHPNALQKRHADCLGVCISICAHHSRVIEATH